MVNFEELIVEAFKGHIRVNETLGTVEVFDDFGVKMVLRDLDKTTLEAFKEHYQTY